LIIRAIKKGGKYELKIATPVKTLNLKSSLSDARSTKLIATASFTAL
jgi:hypothetical protein